MFFENLIWFIKGYVIINVEGKFPERFLNVCANRGILVADVTYLSEKNVRCLMSLKAYKETEEIAKKTFVKINVVSMKGMPVIFSKYKKRKWFLFGPLAFFAVIILLNMFVWEIEISGCNNVLPADIEKNLAEFGVKTGALRFTIDEKLVKNKMLLKMPELSWLWIDKHGSKLTVNVRESVPKPEMFDKDDYCNIVATKDGIIDSVIVKSGTLMFSLGDTVQKNDILVSGLMLSERNIMPRKLQADGEIYARVWYEKTEDFSLFEEKKTETGRVSKRRKIKLFGWEFVPFWYKETEFSEYTTQTDVFELAVFGKYLGLKITTDIFKEYTVESIPLSEETVKDSGIKLLLEKIDEEAPPQAELVNYTPSYVKKDDNTVSVTVICEYIENIGKKVRVE